jgi:hypothetical protein
MFTNEQTILAEYLAAVETVTAIDPFYSDLVRELVKADRRVDFHVDAADALEDDALEDAAAAARQRIHDKHQALWSNACERIEAVLPQREVRNAYKQLSVGLGKCCG